MGCREYRSGINGSPFYCLLSGEAGPLWNASAAVADEIEHEVFNDILILSFTKYGMMVEYEQIPG
jgi:hypothetical protein